MYFCVCQNNQEKEKIKWIVYAHFQRLLNYCLQFLGKVLVHTDWGHYLYSMDGTGSGQEKMLVSLPIFKVRFPFSRMRPVLPMQ